MKARVLVTFDGIAEGKRFHAGKVYDFEPERYEFLAAKGYVEEAGEPIPRPSKKAADNE